MKDKGNDFTGIIIWANPKKYKQKIHLFFMDKELKARFLKVYQNLPLSERKNMILLLENESEREDGKRKGKKDEQVLRKEPLSWDIAYLEIDQETKKGEKILNKLIELNLI
jgi:hypothetical protein